MTKILLALTLLGASALAQTPPPPPSARDAQAEALRKASFDDILGRAEASLHQLGAYRVKLRTQERITGKLKPELQIQLWVREQPLALRLLFIGGPAKGRRVLYDTAVRSDDLRVHETGLLGIAGAMWIGIHNSLVHGDTNHCITDVGLGALLRLMRADRARAQPFGGFTRTDLGWNERGRWCFQFDAPPKATGVYARRAQICVDPESWLPLENTNWDDKGLLETFVFTDLEPHAAEAGKPFSRDEAGL
jgi:Protein of unknown function (DUF1571)